MAENQNNLKIHFPYVVNEYFSPSVLQYFSSALGEKLASLFDFICEVSEHLYVLLSFW